MSIQKRKSTAGRSGLTLAAATLLTLLYVPPGAWGQTARPEDAAIIRHLNAAITWYRQLASANESAGQPSDTFYLENARNLARQALQLAFQSAESETALLLAEAGGNGSGKNAEAPTSGEQSNIAKSAATAAQIAQLQTQIAQLNDQIPSASGKKRAQFEAKRDTLQEELDFNKALEEALQKLSTFMTGNARKRGGLQEEIADLKKTVPEVSAGANGKTAATASSNPGANAPHGAGLIDETSLLIARSSDVHAINQLIAGTGAVIDLVRQVQAPMRTRLRATIAEGRSLTTQPATADAANRTATRERMALLTAQFKQISAAAIPLAQELILLDEAQANLRQWEESAHRGYTQIFRSFLIRLAALLVAILVVLAISKIWRRMAFRYVHEARMQHQLQWLRYLTTGVLMAIVLAFGLASDFSSLATFTGFLAAGIAVAFQTILLSVAGYFFLIGRHGVMAGDRITVSGVTGDVIYVGLTRLYLRELAGSGSDQHPTGRVMVISNSVLFQGSPFLKQTPGAAYAWHEVAVKVEQGGDYARVESRLLGAANAVYAQYRESIEEQHQAAQGLFTASPAAPSPKARLQLVEKGLEVIVRYPVVLNREMEIDNQMAKQVVEAIHGDEELHDAVGSPTIRPVAKA